jgi:hypothetical protein
VESFRRRLEYFISDEPYKITQRRLNYSTAHGYSTLAVASPVSVIARASWIAASCEEGAGRAVAARSAGSVRVVFCVLFIQRGRKKSAKGAYLETSSSSKH